MKTHTELLTNLIAAVYALPIDALKKEINDLQMLAAEIKGRMMNCGTCDGAQSIDSGGVTPWGEGINIACPECLSRSRKAEIAQKPTPDSDGWINNTGVMPEIEVLELRFRDGHICNDPAPKAQYRWHFANNCQDPSVDITHYKPA